MCNEKMPYYAFIDSENAISGLASNFYYNIEGLLPVSQYRMYKVNVEYVLIDQILNADNKTYDIYNSYTYSVGVDFSPCNTLFSDSQLNIYTGMVESEQKRPYYNGATVQYNYSMSKPCLEGKNGSSFLIETPKPQIHIKILNDNDTVLQTVALDDVPRVKMLLKFVPEGI